jgi:C-terminal processing protease CtpA/Prc
MLSRIALKLLLVTSILGGSCSSHAGKPTVGLAVSVEGEGFFLNPVVTRVLVAKVHRNSLAEEAGIAAGNEITHVGDQAIKGRRARELQPLMQFNAGETRVLRLKRINGEQYSATLTKSKE